MESSKRQQHAARFAMAACFNMIAFHVSSKAVRDALFITSFDITSLPVMIIAASMFSVGFVLLSSRVMTRLTPARLVPAAFAGSAVLLLLVWFFLHEAPKTASIVVYLHVVGFGSWLTSGFWSMINERFDPRTARQRIGRIAGMGTLGGIAGGLVAERIAAYASMETMLPVLAAYHLTCAAFLRFLSRPDQLEETQGIRKDVAQAAIAEEKSVFRIMREASYLRTLAAVVILGTISAAMIDYVFKSQAAHSYGGGEPLLRFFAIFYSATGVLTFLVQTFVTRYSLEKLGLAKTVGTLPFAVSFGGLTALVLPGVASATLARALEAVFRGSLFRSGYELFYTPIPTREKRAAKAIVDVGFDRLGDAVGSGFVKMLLPLGPALAIPSILTGAILVALCGLWVAGRLQGAYIGALERGLMERAGDFTVPPAVDTMGMTLLLDPATVTRTIAKARAARDAVTKDLAPAPREPGEPSPVTSSSVTDPLLQRIATLRSGSAAKIKSCLQSSEPPASALIPHLIQLLAWDPVYPDVIRALRQVVEQHVGQLLDAMLNPETDFAIRRRIPRVLTAARLQRAVNGLLLGLLDRRFEVRFQCGRALATILERHPELKILSGEVFAAVHREVAVGRPVWESRRLLDRLEDKDTAPFVDEYLRDRANRSLEHLFTLLSLVLPKDPLKVAFHGLHTDDEQLRGTAIEYLDSILPNDVRDRLKPLLNVDRATRLRDSRSSQEILNELMQSNQSILVNLAELRKRAETKEAPESPK
jgi:ATP:ADP antiporter, AAA family